MPLKKICFIANYNQYESKRYFTQQLADALVQRGIEVNVIDIEEQVLGVEAVKFIKNVKPDLTCSYNSLLPMSNGQFLWDFLEIPHLSILLDPVLYSVGLTRSPLSLISCVDRSDQESLQSLGFKFSFFWPHAASPNEMIPSTVERPYDVVLIGSCYDYESLRVNWKYELSPHEVEIVENAVEIFLSGNDISLSEALSQACNNCKVDLEKEKADLLTLFYFLDYFTRGKDRVDLVRSIRDAKVHIFGDLAQDIRGSMLGWNHYLRGQQNVTIHPPLRFDESLDMLKKSKICLSSAPFFRNGSHERVFNALACGAIPFSSESLYLRQSFQDSGGVLFYQSNRMESINEQINAILRDDQQRHAQVKKGQECIKAKHTWGCRADEFIQKVSSLLKC